MPRLSACGQCWVVDWEILSHPSDIWGRAKSTAGNIYVASLNANSITVYAAGASGDATPTATITGANTGLNLPVRLTF